MQIHNALDPVIPVDNGALSRCMLQYSRLVPKSVSY
jgi:hypothetical protein